MHVCVCVCVCASLPLASCSRSIRVFVPLALSQRSPYDRSSGAPRLKRPEVAPSASPSPRPPRSPPPCPSVLLYPTPSSSLPSLAPRFPPCPTLSRHGLRYLCCAFACHLAVHLAFIFFFFSSGDATCTRFRIRLRLPVRVGKRVHALYAPTHHPQRSPSFSFLPPPPAALRC